MRLPFVAGWMLFCVGAAAVALTVAGVVLDYSPVPYWDQWDGGIDLYVKALTHPWAAWWSWHNEHRLVVPRLIFWADIALAGGVNILALAANLVLAGLIAWVVAAIAAPLRGSQGAGLALTGVICTFVFSWMQFENFTWGFECQWFLANLFALLAFWKLMQAQAAPERWAPFATALLCAVLAMLSLGNGVLTFPVMILAALYWRMSWRRLGLLVVTFAVIARLYYADAPLYHGEAGPLATLLSHPLGVARFALHYYGSPGWYVIHQIWFVELAGGLVCAGVLGGVALTVRRRGAVASPALLLYALFIGATGLATAAGRLALGQIAAMESRYTSNTLLMLLCTLLFLAINLRARFWRGATMGALVASSLVLAGLQARALRSDRDVLFERLEAGAALRAGVYDHAYTVPVYPKAKRIRYLADESTPLRLSIFRGNVPRLPDPPAHLATSAACAGAIDEIQATATAGTWMAHGWIYDAAAATVPSGVWFADIAGNAIGSGVVGAKRLDVASLLHLPGKRFGWTGFLKLPAGEAFRVFGANRARVACAVPMVAVVPTVTIHAEDPSDPETLSALAIVSATGFAPNAIPPNLLAGAPPGIQGSYIQADQTTGAITLRPAQPQPAMRFRYATGPNAGNQGLSVTLDDGTSLAFSLPGTSQAWQTLIIDAQANPHRIATVTVEDRGSGWGEWSAVSTP